MPSLSREELGDRLTPSISACVLTPAYLPEIGGQENHIHELSAALIAHGARLWVITRRFDRAHAAHELFRSVPVVRLTPTGETKGAGWRGLLLLSVFLTKIALRLLRDRRKYEVILVSGFNVLPLVAVATAWLTGKRCVVRPESPMELRHAVGVESLEKMGLGERSLFLKAVRTVRAWAAARVDRYIAISTEIRDGLLAAGIPLEKISSIPNGIDVGKFSPVSVDRRSALRVQLKLPSKARILVYTGRLAVTKGVMMLARVWCDIARDYPDTHLLLVGTGFGSIDGCEAELRRIIADHGLSERASFPGNIANVHEYLQASDIFVFPSDYEGFGLSILEAMAVGLPIITTRVGVAADVVSRYQPDFVVEPKDPAAFEQALRRLLDDAKLQADLGGRAPREVQSQYSMDAIARRHLELFREIVAARK